MARVTERHPNAASDQTKAALAAALKELMKHKSIDRITIRELTDLCGIRRQNFYYHFEDIYDLMKWMFEEEAIPLLEQYEGMQLWQEGIRCFLGYLQENKKVCVCALKSVGRENMKRFFQQNIYAIIHRTAVRIGEEVGIFQLSDKERDVEMMTHYYVLVFASLLESWLLGEIDRTPEEFISFMDQVIHDHIRGAKLRVQGRI